MKDIKRNTMVLLQTISKERVHRKLAGISELDYKGTILKKINVSFIVQLYLGKYSFCHDISLSTPHNSIMWFKLDIFAIWLNNNN